MQVERQPSPWPTVVMLAILVAFCLSVPQHWRKPACAVGEHAIPLTIAPRGAERTVPAYPLLIAAWEPKLWRSQDATTPDVVSPGHHVLDNELLSLWSPPTIDELVAQRIGMSNVADLSSDWTAYATIVTASQPETFNAAGELVINVEPLFITVLDRIVRAIVAGAPTERLQRWTAQAARACHDWSATAASTADETLSADSSLRLVGPEDRAATLPQDAEEAPAIMPDDERLELEPEVDPWVVPQTLFDLLQRIAMHESTRVWAERTLDDLYILTERKSLLGDDVQTVLAQLCESASEAVRMAETTDHDRLRVELLRVHWALARRLDRWSVVHEIRVAALGAERVAARGSLETYFDAPPKCATSPADDLTRQLEAYEKTRDPTVGRQVVAAKRMLETSGHALDRTLADAVEQHYRNANVRFAISAEMLNRFIGEERSEVRPLRDRVGGATIRGQSHLQSASRVTLDPATGHWDLDVESQGTIESNSLADGGQARFRSRTSTDFSARKRIVVDATGVLLQPATIDVDSHNRLMGVTTDVDWVPLFASYARDRAVREYRARQHQAKLRVKSKVAAEAVSTINAETQEAVARIEKQVRDRVTDRLAKFGVKVTPVELTTTHERVVARMRVASDEQAGSHTPRPRALSDSLASAQIHETALTNAAVSLELDGKRFTAAELVAHFQRKFPQAGSPELDDEKRNTVFQFGSRDAVQFHIENGQLEVTLALTSVELDGRRMRNFVVHAFYTPAVNGLEAELVRDGSLGIEGRLSSGERARLHNVFNSVLPPERRVPLVRLDDVNDPRLAGLMITQLVLEDGWIGLAVGPTSSERVAERSRSMH